MRNPDDDLNDLRGIDYLEEIKEEIGQHRKQTQIAAINRRQENIQILTAIGVLGLAGTLYAQNTINFPLLEYFATAPNAYLLARAFIYLNIVFLLVKIPLITIRSEFNQSDLTVEGSEPSWLVRFGALATDIDNRIAPVLFTGLILLIPLILILLVLTRILTTIAPDISSDTFLVISYLIMFVYLVTVIHRLIRGIRSDKTGKEFIEDSREEASQDFMVILDLIDKIPQSDRWDQDEMKSRVEDIIRESRKATDPDRLSEYNAVYRWLIERYPIFAKIFTYSGLTSGDREALKKYLRHIRMQEKRLDSGHFDEIPIEEEYETLDTILKKFEEDLGLPVESEDSDEESRDIDDVV